MSREAVFSPTPGSRESWTIAFRSGSGLVIGVLVFKGEMCKSRWNLLCELLIGFAAQNLYCVTVTLFFTLAKKSLLVAFKNTVIGLGYGDYFAGFWKVLGKDFSDIF